MFLFGIFTTIFPPYEKLSPQCFVEVSSLKLLKGKDTHTAPPPLPPPSPPLHTLTVIVGVQKTSFVTLQKLVFPFYTFSFWELKRIKET